MEMGGLKLIGRVGDIGSLKSGFKVHSFVEWWIPRKRQMGKCFDQFQMLSFMQLDSEGNVFSIENQQRKRSSRGHKLSRSPL
jgi:hypothetical protein